MGNVHAHVTNKSGGKVSLLLDEKDERIEYFKKLVKRDELESVEFSRLPDKKATTSKSPAKKAAPAKGDGDAPDTEDGGAEPSSD